VAQNIDIAPELAPLAGAVSFRWLEQAVKQTDELAAGLRRNLQKSLALDAFALKLQDVR
jgi:hypothetical protein